MQAKIKLLNWLLPFQRVEALKWLQPYLKFNALKLYVKKEA